MNLTIFNYQVLLSVEGKRELEHPHPCRQVLSFCKCWFNGIYWNPFCL